MELLLIFQLYKKNTNKNLIKSFSSFDVIIGNNEEFLTKLKFSVGSYDRHSVD